MKTNKSMFGKMIGLVFLLSFLFFSCQEEEKTDEPVQESEELVVVSNGLFTEYYPGKKHIKFQGQQNEAGQRDGKWVFYSETGLELSVTIYKAGLKHGHTVVKYPDGQLYYYGEYLNDEKVGVWKTYGRDGKILQEKDFGGL